MGGWFRWLAAKVGDKPAWAIVAAAVLAALGSAIGAAVVHGGKVGFDAAKVALGGTSLTFVVREAKSSQPLDGAKIRIIDFTSLKPVPLTKDGATELMTADGIAHAESRVQPGHYSLRAEYSHQGVVYGRFEPIEIKGPLNHTLEFSPDTWFASGKSPSAARVATDTVPASLAASDQAPWMAIAQREIGQREIPGGASNPRIVEYLKEADPALSDEMISWNSAFANWAVRHAGYAGPSQPLQARSWLTWGRAVELTPGCIAVFWRGDPNSWLGHVGFFLGEDGPALKVLGGNQFDSVSIARIDRSRLLSCRMPNPTDRAA